MGRKVPRYADGPGFWWELSTLVPRYWFSTALGCVIIFAATVNYLNQPAESDGNSPSLSATVDLQPREFDVAADQEPESDAETELVAKTDSESEPGAIPEPEIAVAEVEDATADLAEKQSDVSEDISESVVEVETAVVEQASDPVIEDDPVVEEILPEVEEILPVAEEILTAEVEPLPVEIAKAEDATSQGGLIEDDAASVVSEADDPIDQSKDLAAIVAGVLSENDAEAFEAVATEGEPVIEAAGWLVEANGASVKPKVGDETLDELPAVLATDEPAVATVEAVLPATDAVDEPVQAAEIVEDADEALSPAADVDSPLVVRGGTSEPTDEPVDEIVSETIIADVPLDEDVEAILAETAAQAQQNVGVSEIEIVEAADPAAVIETEAPATDSAEVAELPAADVEIDGASVAADLDRALPAWELSALNVPASDGPMVVVIIDDLGWSARRTGMVSALPGHLTMAMLSDTEDSPRQADKAKEDGHELLVHVAMQPKGSENISLSQLTVGMTEDQLRNAIDSVVERFDGVIGINNHMGSLFTSDVAAMRVVLGQIHSHGLIFLDSLTTPDSVAEDIAGELGMPYLGRDIFLDNDRSPEAIRGQLSELERIANKRGWAIAIGHPYIETIDALTRWFPSLDGKGITLVPVSTLIRQQSADTQTAARPAAE